MDNKPNFDIDFFPESSDFVQCLLCFLSEEGRAFAGISSGYKAVSTAVLM